MSISELPLVNGPHPQHLDKFLDKYVFVENGDEKAVSEDSIWFYGVNIIRAFLVLADMKDAVASGNGEHISTLRKQMLLHFFSNPGFNKLSIEMLINLLQCNVLPSEAEAFRCEWAATVN